MLWKVLEIRSCSRYDLFIYLHLYKQNLFLCEACFYSLRTVCHVIYIIFCASYPETCKTIGGANINASCIFPFTYKSHNNVDVIYNGCAMDTMDGKFWCSTKVDRFGQHVSGKGEWGHCSDDCLQELKKGKFFHHFIIHNTFSYFQVQNVEL